MDTWLIASLWVGLALVSAMVSIRLGISVALVEICVGVLAGNFLQAHHEPPQIIQDLDSTDDPLHGNQEGRFFNGYYWNYCYLPLYIFSGEHLLCAWGEQVAQSLCL